MNEHKLKQCDFTRQSFYMRGEIITEAQEEISNAQGQTRGPFLDEM